MRATFLSLCLVVSTLAFNLPADARKTETGYQTATVVSVDKYNSPSTYIGSPSDAPLQTEEYAYDIGIRLNCDVYVGRYESATDYLPAVFATNHAVDVRMQKHVLYVSLPFGDRVVKMGIVGHHHLQENSCPAAS
jgi:hypothetical protein